MKLMNVGVEISGRRVGIDWEKRRTNARARMAKLIAERKRQGLTARGTARKTKSGGKGGLMKSQRDEVEEELKRMDMIAMQDPEVREGRDSEGRGIVRYV